MQTVEPANVDALDTAGAIVAAAPVAAGSWYSLRSNSLNFVRFASVLVGAGLLLRVGAAEQANSTIDDEKAPAEKPQTTRITIPQPTFGLQVASSENAAIARTAATLPTIAPMIATAAQAPGKGASVRAEAPTPAFAAAFGPAADGAGELAPTQLANSQPGATKSKPPQANSSTGRRTATEGLLAPVRIASASAGSLLAPVRAAPAGVTARSANSTLVSATSVTAAPLSAGPTLVAAAPRAIAPTVKAPLAPAARPALASSASSVQAAAAEPSAQRPTSTALANARPQPAALAPAAAQPIASAVIPQPVRISLATPVMTRGPRTTVLTSSIADVMRRPASAWDYAEALSPEMSGAARRSASAQAAGAGLPAETALSPSAQRVPSAQPAPTGSLQAKAATDGRTAALQSQASAPAGTKIALAQPQAAQAQPNQAQPNQAQPSQAQPNQAQPAQDRAAALASKPRVAMLAPARRALPVRALSAGPVKAAPLGFSLKQDELEVVVQQSAGSDMNTQSRSVTGSVTGSGADGPSAETTTLSLLDRMPHPAF